MSIYNVVNFSFFFIQVSEDDKDKTLLKYYAKTIVFDLQTEVPGKPGREQRC